MNNPPSSQQAQSAELYSYTSWRERFLKIVLQGSCILGLVAIILYLFTPSTNGIKLLAVMTYGVLVLVTVLTNLPYLIRAGVFLLLLYFAGFSSLLDHGLGDASILFLGFIVMTGLLFSLRSGHLLCHRNCHS